MQINAVQQEFPLAGTFRISRGAKTETRVVVAAITADGHTGVGECVPYARYGETLDSVCEEIEAFGAANPGGFDRKIANATLKAGAARNAVDCALWDLDAKRSGKRAWELAGMGKPAPALTVYTLSLDTPRAMGESAREHAHRPMLKLKLGPEDAIECVEAVRDGAPDSRLVVDANEAWNIAELSDAMPRLARCNVELIEQPLPAGEDAELAGISRTIAIAADESCHITDDLPGLKGLYDVVNIKLDKTGGLTEALNLAEIARNDGFGIMIGCMMATSLAMAPATLLTAGASVVDLDGPLWMARDRSHPLTYRDHKVYPPDADLWG